MGFAGRGPSDSCERQCQRCIPGAERVSKPADAGATLFRVLHHARNSRVTRIYCQFFSSNVQGRIAIYGARKHLGPWGFRNLERFTRKISFIHLSVSLNDHAIDGTDFVRKYDERIPYSYVREPYIS